MIAFKIGQMQGMNERRGTDRREGGRDMRYELLYGYLHCTGRTEYRAGFAATEEEARAWAERQQAPGVRRMKPPPEDPILRCRAAYCPLKRQRPWFGWRACGTE